MINHQPSRTRFFARRTNGSVRFEILAIVVPILVLFGLIDAWGGRSSYVAGDTVSYMDMARGLAGGDLRAAVNGHWSPLYPAILAVAIRWFEPNSFVEFSIARGVNFLIFLGTLWLFHIFLMRFLDHCYEKVGFSSQSRPAFSRSLFAILAYGLFAWGCFSLTIVSRINPDLCVAATTFAAVSLLLKFKEGQVSSTTFLLFGLVLGVGYLFKAIFFPLALLFLIAAAIEPKVWALRRRLLLSLLAFLLITAPLVTALSIKYDRFTFGETGRNTYRTDVLSMPLVHWQESGPPGFGFPEHPTPKNSRKP